MSVNCKTHQPGMSLVFYDHWKIGERFLALYKDYPAWWNFQTYDLGELESPGFLCEVAPSGGRWGAAAPAQTPVNPQ